MTDSMFSHIPEDRMMKLQRLNQAGVNAFGARFEPRDTISDTLDKFPPFTDKIQNADTHPMFAENVRIAGRIMLWRDFGKLIFMHIQDMSGRMQCALNNKYLIDSNAFKLWKKSLDLGDIVGLEGDLMYTKKGEPTLWIRTLTPLSKSLQTPPEKWHGIQDTELKYRKRYLHLIADSQARNVFITRSKIVSAIRNYMDGHGYLEVEGPVLQTIPGGATARPFVTRHNALDMELYMRIATEIPLKMLLVGGIEKVYEIGRLFRNEGIDTSHNPEFTTIEFYEAYADIHTMVQHTEELFDALSRNILKKDSVEFRGQTIRLTPPFARADYSELLARHASVDIHDVDALKKKLQEKNYSADNINKLDGDALIDKVFGEYVEPHLIQPTFVFNQPASMAPLCKPKPDDESVSDRFELFVNGFEIANAYSELNDPLKQREVLARQAGDIEKGIIEGRIDNQFLDALEYGMPPAGGEGIGIDRLVMLLTEQYSIRDVILFPLLGAKSNG